MRMMLLFVSLFGVACAGARSNNVAVTPPEANSVADAAVADVVSDVPSDAGVAGAVTVQQVRDCTDECRAREAPALLAAVARVEREPRVALTELRSLHSTVAHVWASYTALQLNDTEALAAEDALLEELGATTQGEPQTTPTPTQETLSLLRREYEGISDEAQRTALVPCWLFARHGREALAAFSPVHGSNMDTVANEVKYRCFNERVQAAMNAQEQQAFRASHEALRAAMYRVLPRPEEGTMWTAVVIEATDHLLDAVLAPGTTHVHESDAELTQLVTRAARQHRGLQNRVRAFRRTQTTALPAFSAGICASARSLQRTMTPEACTERARAASTALLHSWVLALSQE